MIYRCGTNSDGVTKRAWLMDAEALAQLCRDFMADCRDGFVSNDIAWIENKLK